MMVIRPINQHDLKSLYRLAAQTGIGFTSLVADEAILQKKVDGAVRSFSKENISKPSDEDYLMVLEDTATGQVVGTCGILATVGLEEPFYSYHLGTITHSSRELGVHNVIPTLILNNDFTGCSEICTLFLEEGYRHSKMGNCYPKHVLCLWRSSLSALPKKYSQKCVA